MIDLFNENKTNAYGIYNQKTDFSFIANSINYLLKNLNYNYLPDNYIS